MRTANIDLWIAHAAPGPAPRGIESTGSPAMNLPWTFAGLPASMSGEGLPLGVQRLGMFGADERLLGWAERLAAALT